MMRLYHLTVLNCRFHSIMSERRVCVNGCGPSGMSVLYNLGKLTDAEIPEIVCYEKQDTVGGLWNTTWRTGIDCT